MYSASSSKFVVTDEGTNVRTNTWGLRAIVTILFCAVVYGCVRYYFIHQNQPLDISRAQAVAFPLFTLFVYFLARLFVPIRVWPILLVLSLGLFGVLYTYNYHLFAGSSFVVATLTDDSFSSESRIFRKSIERESKRTGGIGVASYYATLSSDLEADEILHEDSRTKGVVWGSSRWLNVTLGQEIKTKNLQSSSSWIHEPLRSLTIIEQVSWIGLSYHPVPETAEFLSGLFSGSPDLLRHAAQLKAPWTSYAHRGAPYLALGVFHLRNALGGVSYNPIELDCARESFAAGLSLVKQQDNAELKAALQNNHGVVLYIQGVLEDVKTHRHQGRQEIARAMKVTSRQNTGALGSPKIALQNFQTIRIQHRKK